MVQTQPNRPGTRAERQATVYAPLTDILQFDDRIELHVDLPGVKSDDVSVSFEEGTLSVRAERRDDGLDRLHREYEAATYRRAFTVPEGFDPDRIEARFENGVLILVLPVVETQKARQIPVR